MAKKAKQRTVSVRIKLTLSGYKQVEESAFKNCRTPAQELTYMIERSLGKAEIPMRRPKYDETYDQPQPVETPAQPAVDGAPLASSGPAPAQVWSEAQEAEIYEAGKSAGMSEAQITALKLMHKSPESALEAINCEGASA